MDVSQFDINQSIIIINQSVPTSSSSSHRLLHQQQQPYHHFVVLHLLPTASSSLIIHITWYSSALPSIFSSASSTHFISGRGAWLTRGGVLHLHLPDGWAAAMSDRKCRPLPLRASHVRERETHAEEAERPQWCNTEMMMIMLCAHRTTEHFSGDDDGGAAVLSERSGMVTSEWSVRQADRYCCFVVFVVGVR